MRFKSKRIKNLVISLPSQFKSNMKELILYPEKKKKKKEMKKKRKDLGIQKFKIKNQKKIKSKKLKLLLLLLLNRRRKRKRKINSKIEGKERNGFTFPPCFFIFLL